MIRSEQTTVAAQDRHKAALEYAATKIAQWEYASRINAVYLFGSFARDEHGYDSDVDIYVICAPEIQNESF